MILTTQVQPDLENKEIATWRSFDLIETLLFLADSGHSVQVWDVQSSLLDLIEETWTLLTLYSRLLRRARAGAAADQPAHYATKAGAAREALQGSPHPHPHPPLGLPGVLTPL